MFVEKLEWLVPKEQKQNSLRLLAALRQSMETSGGLVQSLVGSDAECEERLLALNFWKSWEDLSRFLNVSKTPLFTGPNGKPSDRLQMHHYEIIWEWPEEEVNTLAGDPLWHIHDFHVNPEQIEGLLDGLRQLVPASRHNRAFRETAIWIDKNNNGHIILANQWATNEPPGMVLAELNGRIRGPAIEPQQVNSSLYGLRVARPVSVGV